MINRGRVPEDRPLPRPWQTGAPPRPGDYLVVDGWLGRAVGTWVNPYGWCIRGRYLGKDGALCWSELPDVPAQFTRGGSGDGW